MVYKINRCLNHWLLSMQQRWLKTHVTSVLGLWWVCHALVGKHFLKYGLIFSYGSFLVMRHSDLRMSRMELILETSLFIINLIFSLVFFFKSFSNGSMWFIWHNSKKSTVSVVRSDSWVGARSWAIWSSFTDHRRNTSIGMWKKDWWDL